MLERIAHDAADIRPPAVTVISAVIALEPETATHAPARRGLPDTASSEKLPTLVDRSIT